MTAVTWDTESPAGTLKGKWDDDYGRRSPANSVATDSDAATVTAVTPTTGHVSKFWSEVWWWTKWILQLIAAIACIVVPHFVLHW